MGVIIGGGVGISTLAAAAVPGGVDGDVQFNNAGAFGGDAALTFDSVTGTLTADNFVGDGSGLTNIPSNPDITRTTVFNAAAKGTRVVITAGVTIPNATYTPGTTFSFYNSTAAAVTITQAAGLTLRLDGTALTGNRTLAAFGTCIVWYNTADEAIISGSIT